MGMWDIIENVFGSLTTLANPALSLLTNKWVLVIIGAATAGLLCWFVLIPIVKMLIYWIIIGVVMLWHTIF